MIEDRQETQAQDFDASVDWIIDAYEMRNVTFPDGFQKDSIQNSAGARVSNGWAGWKCTFDIIQSAGQQLLVIEDSGTTGLTGPNYSREEIQSLINDKKLNDKPEWRLARFSSRNVSGGNTLGAGKFGVGKTVYSAASKIYKYWFDSYTIEGKYVANYNDRGRLNYMAYEGDQAAQKIKEATGLEPKRTPGTRIIIFEPKDELIDSIQSGEIIKYIQENWWISIARMPEDSGIFINGIRVKLPVLTGNQNYWELSSPYKISPGRIVKHCAINVSKDSDIPWHGIAYFRVGMKIQTVTLDSVLDQQIPAKIRNNIWGYIEVDKAWEEELAEIEDAVHYGLKPHQSRTTIYSTLAGYVNEIVDEKLKDWGYIKDPAKASQRINEILNKVSEKTFAMADALGFNGNAHGEKKKVFEVRWLDLRYPQENSREVTTDDLLEIGFRIKNNSLSKRKFTYTVKVIPEEDGDPKVLFQGEHDLEGGKLIDIPKTIEINKETSFKYQKNTLVLSVACAGSHGIDKKILYFYDTDEPAENDDIVVLAVRADYPRGEEGNRRINSNETLKNITYTIYNKRSKPLDYKLTVSVVLPKKRKKNSTVITEIASVNGSVGIDDEADANIPDITFDAETYEPYVKSGILVLKARLSSTTSGNGFAKGQKITGKEITIFFNKDSKSGNWDSFEHETDAKPNIHKRSWGRIIGEAKIITINSAHPAYKRVESDDALFEDYASQETVKQFVSLYLQSTGDYKFFGIDPEHDEPDAVSQKLTDKIEELYYQILQG